MREIKFRGWYESEKLKTMVQERVTGDCFRWLNEGQPITIMQYTGLKDKNGTEIYEGDVLQPSNREKKYYRVVFENGCFEREYKFIQKYEGEEWLETRLFPIHARGHIVAGNIHQHPELLNN
ncbi:MULTISPECIES: YopX family protein [Bacillaceae]|nr:MULTISPECIES: YopX family protein [Bacillaceae]